MRKLLRTLAVAPLLASTVAAVSPAHAHVVSEARKSRVIDIEVASAATGKKQPVRLLVPDGWSKDSPREWPVLWLLHGGADNYSSWTANTDIERLSADYDAIVVMPDGGRCGNYTDWYNGGRYGVPAWETFHLTELRNLLRAEYRASDRAAIAGNSMGGFGAMSYAARHQGMFRAAASFSGTLDSLLSGHIPSGPLFIATTTAVACPGTDSDDIWGDEVEQRANWKAHNPTSLAGRLAGVSLYVSAGTGRPGPLNSTPIPDLVLEPQVRAESLSFVSAAKKAGVPVVTNFYTRGTHSWPYWQRELHRAYPSLMKAIGG